EAWPAGAVEIRTLDVTDPIGWEAAVAAARQRFGGLDVLVNVAGVLTPGWAHEIPEAAIDAHLDVNVKGVVHGVRAVVPAMLAQGRGHIVNVASLAALAPVPGLALYCASKHAVRGYSLSLALELRPRGIAVTVVCPDAVQTPMLDVQRDVDAAALTFSGPRVLAPREVAQAIVRALDDRPLELMLPPSRGWLAKLGGLVPATARALEPVLRRQGRRRQRRGE
ncbi:MAG: SDR family NAD(P)-dependent oxidoreductase, partial [Myxococcales bacterium]|nr:SDR family NAD(P)-dependent oxidoreductase [Myxococcales bacterium]